MDDYPNLFGEGFTAAGYCAASNNGGMCDTLTMLEPFGMASADTRSVQQFAQNGIEGRFQAFAPDYDQAGGRQTEEADIK